ncbi:hypothetical protein [Pseudomonas sp. I2]|uniref:hypothetical protein n=1 Tax=Pseudomonas sp. I2 TaxID=1338438 RepID=UPI0034D6599D
MAYSLPDLLDALKKGDAMHGWGAILALGRDPVNEALQTRYVEAFGLEGMATPISGSYYIDESRTEQVTFDNVVLGPAQLSFKGAVGTSTRLKVTMELIAGSCLYTSMLAGNVQRFRKKDVLYLGMGYRFEVIGELKVVPDTYLRRRGSRGQSERAGSFVGDGGERSANTTRPGLGGNSPGNRRRARPYVVDECIRRAFIGRNP